MPEPNKPPGDQSESADDLSSSKDAIDQPSSTAGEDAMNAETRTYKQPQDEFNTEDSDSFDHTILSASTNPQSMGRLGKYDVIELIGQGGMGVVMKGFDESLGRHVAIKMLSRQLAGSATSRRRFTREAKAVAAINHPNVITIHGVEEQNGLPFFVMEIANGGSLQQRIKKKAPLPLADILRMGTQIASGLAAAHAQGVIHRDIKPGNVMLEDQIDRVKITDFGLALVTMDNSELTSQDNRLGTPSYMSPEQVQGHTVDERSDLFSFGCVLHAMVAGKSPFRGTHAFDAARKILEDTPTPLNEIDNDIPPFLAEIVSKLLEKDPKDRYQTAAEVGEVLNHYLSRLNQSRTDQLHALKEESLTSTSAPSTKRRIGILILLVAAVVAATSPLWFPSHPPLTEGPVDLLARINLEQDVVSGSSWSLDKGQLITGIGRGAKLQIPYSGLTNYQLEVIATRREQTGPLVSGLIVGNSQCYLLIDAYRNDSKSITAFGLNLDGNLIDQTEEIHLLRNEPTKIICRVTPSKFRINVGESEVFNWEGDHRELKLGAGWSVSNRKSFFIGTNK